MRARKVPLRARRARNIVRVLIPDSHGIHIDIKAAGEFLEDVRALDPDEIVWLGDHLDCGGVFSTHQRNFTAEMSESYQEDALAANYLLDGVVKRAPRAHQWYLEGNHEGHVERWASRLFHHKKDADALIERFGPAEVLQLKRRGIPYYRRGERYQGVSIPGTIRLGKCYFTHGISAATHTASMHLQRFGANVVFGHVHRSQALVERTVSSDGYGAWCPGTLAKLQPLYQHTSPSRWTHGYGVQFVAPSGNFIHLNVPILHGVSLLREVARRMHV